jgi:hypothetical protein
MHKDNRNIASGVRSAISLTGIVRI